MFLVSFVVIFALAIQGNKASITFSAQDDPTLSAMFNPQPQGWCEL